jgi:alpha-beta hydrolase superfamily lysophospholipase
VLLDHQATVRETLPPGVATGFVWRPASHATCVVVLVHGLQSHADWFAEPGLQLARRGVAVYAPDRRGSGASTAPRGDPDRPLPRRSGA